MPESSIAYQAARQATALLLTWTGPEAEPAPFHQAPGWVTGPDGPSLLHRILSNEVNRLGIGQANRSFLLTTKGKYLAETRVLRLADRILLDSPAAQLDKLLEGLETYHFSEDLELEDRLEHEAILTLVGPTTADVLRERLGVTAPETHGHASSFEHAGVVGWALRWDRFGVPGVDLRLPLAALPALLQRLQGSSPLPVLTASDFESLRVESGEPLGGVDLDESVIPLEAEATWGISFGKGCYVGQETIARLDAQGHTNRSLRRLQLSNDVVVDKGTPVFAAGEERSVGVITSQAWSPAHQAALALGYVRREKLAPGTTLQVGSVEATLSATVLPVAASFGDADRR